ncbi:MAG: hypothetical protein VXA08_02930 [Alphaproteobacteria bacterium]
MTDAPLKAFGPREKHMYVLDRVREERDRRKRQTRDGTRSCGFANLPTENGNGWQVNRKWGHPYFQSSFNFYTNTNEDVITLCAFNDAEMKINLQLKAKFEDANHNSLHNQRKRKVEVLDADAQLNRPREKHMYVIDRVRKERDRRIAMNEDGMRQHGFANLPDKNGKGWQVNRKGVHPRFKTSFNFCTDTKKDIITLYAYNDAEMKINLQFKAEFDAAKFNSWHNRRKRKAELLDANAEKRAKNIETHGDNSNLERRLLNLWPPRCALRSLEFLVLMLATKADALFRNDALPPDMYMCQQHKTCGKIQKLSSGTRRYQFSDITGYDGCIVVFECEEDGAVFWAFGNAVNKAYETRESDGLKITISKNDNENKGWKMGEPILDEKPWLNYLGRGDRAKRRLPKLLERMCNERRLPLCTMRQANKELGPSSAFEEANNKRWIRVKYGGLARDDDPRWLELPQDWQDKKHIYMLTRSGHVIAYPEDNQLGKTDLYEYSPDDGYAQKLRVQCKPAHVVNSEQKGLLVGMATPCGRIDGKRQWKNTYKDGDNDLYSVHYYDPETREFHYWEFTNAEMVEHTYIGEGAADAFDVYTQNNRISEAFPHAWTWEKHVWATLMAPATNDAHAE